MKSPAFPGVFPFKVRPHDLISVDPVRAGKRLNIQPRCPKHRLNLLPITGVIRHDRNHPPPNQLLTHRFKETVVYEPPFMVSRLRPRVRKVHMDGLKARIRHEFGKEVRRLRPRGAYVSAACPPQPVRSVPPEPIGVLQPEKVHAGPQPRLPDDEGSLPHPNLDFDRVGVSKQLLESQRPRSRLQVDGNGFHDERRCGLHLSNSKDVRRLSQMGRPIKGVAGRAKRRQGLNSRNIPLLSHKGVAAWR